MISLRPSTLAHIDLTALLIGFKPKTPRNLDAEEFSLSALGMMARWVLGSIALFSVALILWA